MAKTAADRVKRAKAKRDSLIDKGVAFNPERMSAGGIKRAQANLRTGVDTMSGLVKNQMARLRLGTKQRGSVRAKRVKPGEQRGGEYR